jgi:hypothetical protein
MIAKSRRIVSSRRTRLALGVALLFLATTVNVEAGEAQPNQRRAANAKAAAAKKTKPAVKAPSVAANSSAAAKS